jgi:hypothetical protein
LGKSNEHSLSMGLMIRYPVSVCFEDRTGILMRFKAWAMSGKHTKAVTVRVGFRLNIKSWSGYDYPDIYRIFVSEL